MRQIAHQRLARKLRKWNESAGIKYSNTLSRLFPKRTKVKLVAIAKDEAAYLVDWIFHHLYFGFDHIDIYINNTTDNTPDLIEALKPVKNVTFLDGDPFFQQTDKAPQLHVYLEALKGARWQGYSHVMFLDIDEFYTPLTFDLEIGNFLGAVEAQVCCLEWVHKLDEDVPFSDPYSNNFSGRRAPQVKSILRTGVVPKLMNPHNVYAEEVTYQLADGTHFVPSEEIFSRVPSVELSKPLKSVFVLHRMVRHQIEYVAALKRGRPIQSAQQGSIFKNNRSGIFEREPSETIEFPKANMEKYNKKKQEFIERFQLTKAVEEGRECVMNRYKDVLDMIANAPLTESETLRKILKNVTLNDVSVAYQHFKDMHAKKI